MTTYDYHYEKFEYLQCSLREPDGAGHVRVRPAVRPDRYLRIMNTSIQPHQQELYLSTFMHTMYPSALPRHLRVTCK